MACRAGWRAAKRSLARVTGTWHQICRGTGTCGAAPRPGRNFQVSWPGQVDSRTAPPGESASSAHMVAFAAAPNRCTIPAACAAARASATCPPMSAASGQGRRPPESIRARSDDPATEPHHDPRGSLVLDHVMDRDHAAGMVQPCLLSVIRRGACHWSGSFVSVPVILVGAALRRRRGARRRGLAVGLPWPGPANRATALPVVTASAK